MSFPLEGNLYERTERLMVRQAHHDRLTMTYNCHPEPVEGSRRRLVSGSHSCEAGVDLISSMIISITAGILLSTSGVKLFTLCFCIYRNNPDKYGFRAFTGQLYLFNVSIRCNFAVSVFPCYH